MTLRSFVARQVISQDEGSVRWVETRGGRSPAVRRLEQLAAPAAVDPDDLLAPVRDGLERLVDCDQVAGRLGVSRRDATLIVEHPRFPSPVGYFRGRRLWNVAAVDGWHEAEHRIAPDSTVGPAKPGDRHVPTNR